MVWWTGIPGFLLAEFYFPPHENHIVTPVGVPAKSCEHLCAARTDCCRWGVSVATEWEDVGVNEKGITELGWEMSFDGNNLANVNDATWCTTKVCNDNAAVKMKVSLDKNAGKWNVILDHTPNTAAGDQTIGIDKFPGKGGEQFYILVTVSNDGYAFFDKVGNKVVDVAEVNALKNLVEDPAVNHNEVLFVKSYTCALFKKETKTAKLHLHTAVTGLLAKCDGHGHESNVNNDQAFAAALHKFGGRWSVDVAAGRSGISFASIVCAVFSSVALVFLVLFVAKKKSDFAVVITDE